MLVSKTNRVRSNGIIIFITIFKLCVWLKFRKISGNKIFHQIWALPYMGNKLIANLVVRFVFLGLAALSDSISVYIEPPPGEGEKGMKHTCLCSKFKNDVSSIRSEEAVTNTYLTFYKLGYQ